MDAPPLHIILALLLCVSNFSVVQQFYQTRVIDEFVLKGNSAILKCNLPSFIADFVYVEAWIADDGTEILPNTDDFGIYSPSLIFLFTPLNLIAQLLKCTFLNADFHNIHNHQF